MPSSSNSRANREAIQRPAAVRRAVCLVLAGVSWLIPSASAVPATVGLAPNQIDSLGLWLSAADLAGTLAQGEAINCWPDRSGHGFDAVFEARVPQTGRIAGLHRPPVFKTAAGRAAVAFTAAERQTLVLGMAGRALGQKVGGFTLVFVIRPTLTYPPAPSSDMPWTPRRYLFISHLSDYSTRVSVQVIQDTGEVRLLTRPVPGAELQRTTSLAAGARLVLRDHAWQRLAVSVDLGKKEARILIDGAGVKQSLPPAGAATFEDLPSPVTGIGSTTLGDWINCEMAEIICYERALEPRELQSLDAYLVGRYPPVP